MSRPGPQPFSVCPFLILSFRLSEFPCGGTGGFPGVDGRPGAEWYNEAKTAGWERPGLSCVLPQEETWYCRVNGRQSIPCNVFLRRSRRGQGDRNRWRNRKKPRE